MARPTLELIEALRNTADKIESGEWEFKWLNSESCNCGLLVRSILGEPVSINGSWNSALNYPEATCFFTETGMKNEEIFSKLRSVGLTDTDLRGLELFEHSEVLERAEAEDLYYEDPEDVVIYMRTWADILEEKREAVEGIDD